MILGGGFDGGGLVFVLHGVGRGGWWAGNVEVYRGAPCP